MKCILLLLINGKYIYGTLSFHFFIKERRIYVYAFQNSKCFTNDIRQLNPIPLLIFKIFINELEFFFRVVAGRLP